MTILYNYRMLTTKCQWFGTINKKWFSRRVIKMTESKKTCKKKLSSKETELVKFPYRKHQIWMDL
jgi:hypothetical protein